MSKNEGIQFTEEEKKVGNLLKDLWKGFFWILNKSFVVIFWIATVVIIHYVLSIIAKRSVFVFIQKYASLEPHKMTLYKLADWKIPPIVGPLLISAITFLHKIYWNIRTFL